MIQERPTKKVVVIFQATQQETESLALAFGLGAVRAGADMRLRHLAPSPAASLAHAGYGTLRVEDLRWAEGIGIFLESKDPAGLRGLRSALEGIATSPDNGSKVVYLFHSDRSADSLLLLESTTKRIGFRRMSDPMDGIRAPEHMTEMGHHMVGHAAKES